MIIWVNGAVGVGKTSVCLVTSSLLSGSYVWEPEHGVGWVHRRTVGSGLFRPADLQARRGWRRRVVRDLDRLVRNGRTVLVPMTVLRITYLDEMLSGLRALGHPVSHVLLDAPAEVLRARIGPDDLDPVASPNRERHIAAYESARADLVSRGSTFHANLHTAREIAAAICDTTRPVQPSRDDSPPTSAL